jgi:ABC-type multidrug transport system fused ATPase/permease subunit
VPDAPDAVDLKNGGGNAIEFAGVSFGYTEERGVLQDINFTIEPGQTVAFVGGTGTGKSTLLSLVPRFYDPTSGTVSLDGRNLRSITKKACARISAWSFRTRFSFPPPFAKTSPAGKPGATDAEIEEAARKAQALDFIGTHAKRIRQPGR